MPSANGAVQSAGITSQRAREVACAHHRIMAHNKSFLSSF